MKELSLDQNAEKKSFNFGKIALPDRIKVLLNLTVADELIPQATKFVTTIYKIGRASWWEKTQGWWAPRGGGGGGWGWGGERL